MGRKEKKEKKIPKCRNSNLTRCIFSQKTKITQVLEFYISCNRLFAKPPCKWVFFFFWFFSIGKSPPKWNKYFLLKSTSIFVNRSIIILILEKKTLKLTKPVSFRVKAKSSYNKTKINTFKTSIRINWGLTWNSNRVDSKHLSLVKRFDLKFKILALYLCSR